ncbi:hypothetical protein GGQ91_002545 [Methylobacterium fujisawaense]|uniref:Uncharacterized protein n=1 Tax=Methylobacterium fujisawaense TaxID=107400 RepID=A0ABR6DAN7_9HYPH|nr:hypothetical protein [Methylobacterium fujisawaense]MBA9063157.1 hypothetical protein [Methylobacterium fujisawaense]
MRRWPIIVLCLVLFAGIMLAVRAVLGAGLHATIPGFDAWRDEAIGHSGHIAILIAVLLACALFGFWPRDARGRMKPLSRR